MAAPRTNGLTYLNIPIYCAFMARQKTKRALIDLDSLAEAAECLKTLAHPVRLRMVQLLLAGEYNVGELAEACDVPSHVASEHLGLMKDRGLLGRERRGRENYYYVAEEALRGILRCVESHFRTRR